ncbi:MAG: 16S rRNA (adenine(1518)-N(6)/adenine(1519)-N(6))-dimethyltransferase RsmA [Treponema sp.]|uniref:16S rRNA (adenine(1518)-N(6)/adenine(1519)-N(6))- dimethyltransferase RsmA n=1 Tax=Treponema sp. TaxID=166 RepID=UPI002A90E619|nr:16S rRNA (adenine(1518)-N(6)/adenine(1519)-N(6))-dimethyltransferase RsmA [Treponema sp.]MDY6398814.1 16S rRNA (adenine(1518)-N(6)/adenine(1519)-N(6))-dimethyltransferase RsmA [Treponema sp.]
MEHPDYNSPLALKAFLDENGMAMQKKFGQNFLVNADARKKIIDSLDIDENSTVWEVGPGLGSMTDEILGRGAKLTAFEIDHGFARLVRQFFEDYSEKGKFELVEGDVLKTWKKYSDEHGTAQRFFGNLPYNVAATIIADTINEGVRFDKAVVTIQKEVAQRMTAKEGTENYSSFSVLCQWAYNVKNIVDLAGGNFWPVPNVASRAVLMTKREDFPRCQNPKLFMKMLRQLFSSRRKTVRNNMLALAGNEKTDLALEKAGIKGSVRAEDLSVDMLLKLSDALNEVM